MSRGGGIFFFLFSFQFRFSFFNLINNNEVSAELKCCEIRMYTLCYCHCWLILKMAIKK